MDERLRSVAAVREGTETIAELCLRFGIEAQKHRRRIPTYDSVFPPATGPNDRWNVDFKGWFRTRDGSRCDPLTVTDDWSRYLLTCQVVEKADYTDVRGRFEKAFEQYGTPARIRLDSGAPFATRGLSGLSRLSIWWLKLGILPEKIAPGHPEQNGRHRLTQTDASSTSISPTSSSAESTLSTAQQKM